MNERTKQRFFSFFFASTARWTMIYDVRFMRLRATISEIIMRYSNGGWLAGYIEIELWICGYNETELIPPGITMILQRKGGWKKKKKQWKQQNHVHIAACPARSRFMCTYDEDDESVSLNIIYMTRRALCNQTSLTFHLIFHDESYSMPISMRRWRRRRKTVCAPLFTAPHSTSVYDCMRTFAISATREEKKKKNENKCRSIGQI